MARHFEILDVVTRRRVGTIETETERSIGELVTMIRDDLVVLDELPPPAAAAAPPAAAEPESGGGRRRRKGR